MLNRQVRVARIVEYIQQNLDRKLSVARLGQVAHISKFHLHREFKKTTGMRLAELVRLLRLKRASFRLVFAERVSITRIGWEAGFANPESFSRAFRNSFGQSPRQFRRAPAWRCWRDRLRFLQRMGGFMPHVEIVDFPETKVAALEHLGPPDDVYNTTRRFIEWRRANGVSPATSRTYGVHYNDQAAVKPEHYRIDICASIDRDVVPNAHGVVTKVIPGGRCARMRHHGSREHIECVNYLYRDWLPKSGETLRDFPIYFHYVNVGADVRDHEMITDVYLPLE
jgi:AraC family transcriptional regulator